MKKLDLIQYTGYGAVRKPHITRVETTILLYDDEPPCLMERRRCQLVKIGATRNAFALGGVKRFRIVKDKLRNWKKGFSDKVIEPCCGLHNFRLNFRPWCYKPPFT